MSEAALVQVPQCDADSEILKLIAELKDVFENHFDRTWFSLLLDELPVDLRTMRDIRELVTITVLYPGEERLVWQGVLELETFTLAVKHFLLPVLKERLGVSWLLPQKRVRDTQQYILRKFVAFTFPYNLERLRRLTAKLKACLLLYYPWLS
ncbi:MAG TPA: hypothetical protein VHE79_14150 [Spirochaetia bacterium]